ncbi:hypothetical protein [Streptantibioticus cattleyicolor]|uniref:hypothetical protein n=1 Tax=Streptantibioticus cattleyicolor TaxID=29303 RepID=UPI0002D7ED84|nr:hypothetical protein [Streptantibioticus cattleyicolor]
MSAASFVRASSPATVRTEPAIRIAASFWLGAERLRPTEAASSVMAVGPWARSRGNAMTTLRLSPSLRRSA